MDSQFNLYILDPPSKWRAGRTSEGEFFFKCAVCDSEMIAGAVGKSPVFNHLAVVSIPGSAFVKPAMYCKDHIPPTERIKTL